tara:strand:- start:334 stop:669 length:336 start_codon:yes stop_codon:yes gene_type:complete
MMIFKILRESEFSYLEKNKTSLGSEDDKRDGFIHFSTAEQLEDTLQRFFCDECKLILLAIDSKIFKEELKWEIARNNQSFPHLYGQLNLDHASWVAPIELDGETHILPPAF